MKHFSQRLICLLLVLSMIRSASRMGGLLSLLPHDQFDRRAAETEGLAQAVFQIPLVGEVKEIRAVAEDHERGGRHADLGHIVDF